MNSHFLDSTLDTDGGRNYRYMKGASCMDVLTGFDRPSQQRVAFGSRLLAGNQQNVTVKLKAPKTHFWSGTIEVIFCVYSLRWSPYPVKRLRKQCGPVRLATLLFLLRICDCLFVSTTDQSKFQALALNRQWGRLEKVETTKGGLLLVFVLGTDASALRNQVRNQIARKFRRTCKLPINFRTCTVHKIIAHIPQLLVGVVATLL